jgi:RNA polymerase sigma-70 factor (ECF subfamily)
MRTGRADETLAARARRGDERALSDLAERWQAPVLRFCRRRLANEDDARDVAQESMLRVSRAIGTYDPDRPFAPWIFRIARNACLNHLERGRVRATATPAARVPEPPPDVLVVTRDEIKRVRRALRTLAKEDRELLTMKLIGGMGNAEIARRLGITCGALRTRACRALSRLREQLGGNGRAKP